MSFLKWWMFSTNWFQPLLKLHLLHAWFTWRFSASSKWCIIWGIYSLSSVCKAQIIQPQQKLETHLCMIRLAYFSPHSSEPLVKQYDSISTLAALMSLLVVTQSFLPNSKGKQVDFSHTIGHFLFLSTNLLHFSESHFPSK